MNNCKEFVLDDAIAVTAIPIDDMNIATAPWQLNPVIQRTGDGFSPTLTHAITIGLRPAATGGTLVPIHRNTGKANDEEADSVAGRLHTVTVNCQVDEREPEIWTHLLTLERTPSHLLLTFRDGSTQAFVAATRDAYTCTTSRDGAKTTVSFRIQCLMGIQTIA